MLSAHHASSSPLTICENQAHSKEGQSAKHSHESQFKNVSWGPRDKGQIKSQQVRFFFYGSDIWLVGSLFTEKPKISLNLCCWYHPVTVNFTTKVSREFSAFGNFLGFKWLALWFSTFYRTRWRETTDSLLYQVSLFCILLQCYLFNLCHFIIQLISMTNLVF